MSSALMPPSAGCIAVGTLNQARRHGRLSMRPEATPNLAIIGLVDQALERDGALATALAAHEAATPTFVDKRRMRLDLFEKNPELFARR